MEKVSNRMSIRWAAIGGREGIAYTLDKKLTLFEKELITYIIYFLTC